MLHQSRIDFTIWMSSNMHLSLHLASMAQSLSSGLKSWELLWAPSGEPTDLHCLSELMRVVLQQLQGFSSLWSAFLTLHKLAQLRASSDGKA